MEFSILSEEEFGKFESANSYGNIMQTVERAKLREEMGYHCFLVGVKKDNEVLACGLIVERFGEAWIQIGPILDWKKKSLIMAFVAGAEKFCREKGMTELEIYPPVVLSVRDTHGEKLKENNWDAVFEIFKELGFLHTGFSIKTEYKALRWMFVKDLTGMKDMREVELSFDATRRKRYHRALRDLYVYRLTDKSELKNWIKGLWASDERNGLNTRDLKYFEDMWDIYGDKAMFLEARRKEGDEMVASEIDIWHENELVTFLSGIPAEFRRENGMTAIKGWQMEEMMKRGIMRLNMYGIEGTFTKDNPLLTTKGEFGGVVEEYIGGFKKILRPAAFYKNRAMRKIKRLIGK